MPRLRMRSIALIRGASVFLTAPRFVRKLPPRLSGNPRKKRGFASVGIFLWLKLAHTSTIPRALLPIEALTEYIGRIDDLIDQVNRPDIRNIISYRSDPTLRQHISHFVNGVKSSQISVSQKREILRAAGDFRRRSWNILLDFEKKQHTLTAILKMKEDTSGEYGRLVANLLNISENIPASRRKKIEGAFSNSFMAFQLCDDLVDFKEDYREQTPNVAMSILRTHPAEMKKALACDKLTPLWLRRHCPQTHKQVRELLDSYLANLPIGTPGEQAFQALHRIAWWAIHLPRLK